MVYSLYLLCPQSSHQHSWNRTVVSYIQLTVLPQWPCWPGRLTTTLGTKTSVKPSYGIPNSYDEMKFPPTAYELTCLVWIWLPSRETLSSWQFTGAARLFPASGLHAHASPDWKTCHLPFSLCLWVRGGPCLSCCPLFPSIQHSTWGHWGAQYVKALMKKPGFQLWP